MGGKLFSFPPPPPKSDKPSPPIFCVWATIDEGKKPWKNLEISITRFRDISRFTCYPNPGIRQGTKTLHRSFLTLLDTPSHLAWSESWSQLAVVPEVEIWTYTGTLGQLSWPKTASTGRYRLNRIWKYGGNMCNRFPVHGYLLDPYVLRDLSVTVLAMLMGDRQLKISKSRHFSYKFWKNPCRQICPKWLEMVWNAKKNTILRYFNSSGVSRFFRSRIVRYGYKVASLTLCSGGIFRLRLLQFGTLMELLIAYRLQKTILEYLYLLLRYGKPNMAKCYDINPHLKISTPTSRKRAVRF